MAADSGTGSNTASVIVASGPLAAPVLGRVVGMLTARADCPLDRLADALRVADAIAARAASFSPDGRVHARVAVELGSLELLIGPLRPDGAEDLIASAALPGIGNVLERVSDELESERDADDQHEYLRIRLAFDVQRAPMIDRMGSDAS
jgi:serine/threonine-protein kinase RsbW